MAALAKEISNVYNPPALYSPFRNTIIYFSFLEKLRQQDIYKDVGAAARLAVGNLPDFLKECSVVYLPEMGHLIVIKEWEEGCDPDKLEYLDFKFVVSIISTLRVQS